MNRQANNDTASIAERLRTILTDLFMVDKTEITPNTDIVDDLAADELDLVELVMAIEDEWGIEIADDDVFADVRIDRDKGGLWRTAGSEEKSTDLTEGFRLRRIGQLTAYVANLVGGQD